MTRGETASYIVRRLKRDHPAIAEKLASGDYPSARAAGIAAGIVKVAAPLELATKAKRPRDMLPRGRRRRDGSASHPTPKSG